MEILYGEGPVVSIYRGREFWCLTDKKKEKKCFQTVLHCDLCGGWSLVFEPFSLFSIWWEWESYPEISYLLGVWAICFILDAGFLSILNFFKHSFAMVNSHSDDEGMVFPKFPMTIIALWFHYFNPYLKRKHSSIVKKKRSLDSRPFLGWPWLNIVMFYVVCACRFFGLVIEGEWFEGLISLNRHIGFLTCWVPNQDGGSLICGTFVGPMVLVKRAIDT